MRTCSIRQWVAGLLCAALCWLSIGVESLKSAASCTPVYGIRMGPTGGLERILDGAHCQMVNATIIGSFLVTLKAQLANRSLDLEIVNCTVPVLDRTLLAQTPIRRLRINNSGLEKVLPDGFKGLENVLEELELSYNLLREIPAAVSNLTVLSQLDLSRNNIRSLPQGSVFFYLLKLRHLNLNHNRLGFLDTVRSGRKGNDGVLPLAIFNLEPLREHLETLQLRSNNLTAFPEQFGRPFGQLRRLDLSGNQFQSIPTNAFAQMPQLRELYLDTNALARIRQLRFSDSLEFLSLRDNPLICDCHALWLWHLARAGENGTRRLDVRLPACREPVHYQDLQLGRLAPNFCNSTFNRMVNRTEDDVMIGPVAISVVASTDSAGVRIKLPEFNVSEGNLTFTWEITHREFGHNQRTSINGSTLVGGAGNGSRDWLMNVSDLKPSTGYRICVDITLQLQENQVYCQEITTLEEQEVFPAATEIAVAASVSTSTTLAVVVVVCCCCPGMRCGKKKGKVDPQKEGEVEKDQIQVVANGDAHMPVKLNNNNRLISDSWRSRPSHFATVHLQRQVSDEESRRMFQATCEYLRRRSYELPLPLPLPRLPARNATPAEYVTPETDSIEQGGRQRGTNHFNSSYGIIEAQSRQNARGYLADAAVHPIPVHQYYTWRRRPLTWTAATFNHVLANIPAVPVQQQHNGAAHAIPVYSMATLPHRHFNAYSLTNGLTNNNSSSKNNNVKRNENRRFHWSAAPPLQTADMQF